MGGAVGFFGLEATASVDPDSNLRKVKQSVLWKLKV